MNPLGDKELSIHEVEVTKGGKEHPNEAKVKIAIEKDGHTYTLILFAKYDQGGKLSREFGKIEKEIVSGRNDEFNRLLQTAEKIAMTKGDTLEKNGDKLKHSHVNKNETSYSYYELSAREGLKGAVSKREKLTKQEEAIIRIWQGRMTSQDKIDEKAFKKTPLCRSENDFFACERFIQEIEDVSNTIHSFKMRAEEGKAKYAHQSDLHLGSTKGERMEARQSQMHDIAKAKISSEQFEIALFAKARNMREEVRNFVAENPDSADGKKLLQELDLKLKTIAKNLGQADLFEKLDPGTAFPEVFKRATKLEIPSKDVIKQEETEVKKQLKLLDEQINGIDKALIPLKKELKATESSSQFELTRAKKWMTGHATHLETVQNTMNRLSSDKEKLQTLKNTLEDYASALKEPLVNHHREKPAEKVPPPPPLPSLNLDKFSLPTSLGAGYENLKNYIEAKGRSLVNEEEAYFSVQEKRNYFQRALGMGTKTLSESEKKGLKEKISACDKLLKEAETYFVHSLEAATPSTKKEIDSRLRAYETTKKSAQNTIKELSSLTAASLSHEQKKALSKAKLDLIRLDNGISHLKNIQSKLDHFVLFARKADYKNPHPNEGSKESFESSALLKAYEEGKSIEEILDRGQELIDRNEDALEASDPETLHSRHLKTWITIAKQDRDQLKGALGLLDDQVIAADVAKKVPKEKLSQQIQVLKFEMETLKSNVGKMEPGEARSALVKELREKSLLLAAYENVLNPKKMAPKPAIEASKIEPKIVEKGVEHSKPKEALQRLEEVPQTDLIEDLLPNESFHVRGISIDDKKVPPRVTATVSHDGKLFYSIVYDESISPDKFKELGKPNIQKRVTARVQEEFRELVEITRRIEDKSAGDVFIQQGHRLIQQTKGFGGFKTKHVYDEREIKELLQKKSDSLASFNLFKREAIGDPIEIYAGMKAERNRLEKSLEENQGTFSEAKIKQYQHRIAVLDSALKESEGIIKKHGKPTIPKDPTQLNTFLKALEKSIHNFNQTIDKLGQFEEGRLTKEEAKELSSARLLKSAYEETFFEAKAASRKSAVTNLEKYLTLKGSLALNLKVPYTELKTAILEMKALAPNVSKEMQEQFKKTIEGYEGLLKKIETFEASTPHLLMPKDPTRKELQQEIAMRESELNGFRAISAKYGDTPPKNQKEAEDFYEAQLEMGKYEKGISQMKNFQNKLEDIVRTTKKADATNEDTPEALAFQKGYEEGTMPVNHLMALAEKILVRNDTDERRTEWVAKAREKMASLKEKRETTEHAKFSVQDQRKSEAEMIKAAAEKAKKVPIKELSLKIRKLKFEIENLKTTLEKLNPNENRSTLEIELKEKTLLLAACEKRTFKPLKDMVPKDTILPEKFKPLKEDNVKSIEEEEETEISPKTSTSVEETFDEENLLERMGTLPTANQREIIAEIEKEISAIEANLARSIDTKEQKQLLAELKVKEHFLKECKDRFLEPEVVPLEELATTHKQRVTARLEPLPKIVKQKPKMDKFTVKEAPPKSVEPKAAPQGNDRGIEDAAKKDVRRENVVSKPQQEPVLTLQEASNKSSEELSKMKEENLINLIRKPNNGSLLIKLADDIEELPKPVAEALVKRIETLTDEEKKAIRPEVLVSLKGASSRQAQMNEPSPKKEKAALSKPLAKDLSRQPFNERLSGNLKNIQETHLPDLISKQTKKMQALFEKQKLADGNVKDKRNLSKELSDHLKETGSFINKLTVLLEKNPKDPNELKELKAIAKKMEDSKNYNLQEGGLEAFKKDLKIVEDIASNELKKLASANSDDHPLLTPAGLKGKSAKFLEEIGAKDLANLVQETDNSLKQQAQKITIENIKRPPQVKKKEDDDDSWL